MSMRAPTTKNILCWMILRVVEETGYNALVTSENKCKGSVVPCVAHSVLLTEKKKKFGLLVEMLNIVGERE